MIFDIKELNFPRYATLTGATVTLQDMADKTITTQVKIDGNISPDFSYDWAVEFRGEKYIMPLRQPQGAKDNTSLLSTIDLTFYHWAIYWLKQKYFFQYTSTQAGTAIPDKWIVPLRLNLADFCEYLEKVCRYWYGDKITVDLNPKWIYDPAPVGIDISYSYIWDILIKIHELYGVRWHIQPTTDINHYAIKIGYPTTEISHIFEYGFDGGLLKVERQIQDDNIRNVILGRGSDKNLPYRYYKDTDPANDSFHADPDWIPELASVPFAELRGATFRSYIQGWKTKHYGNATVSEADKAYAPWAWTKGYTDTLFDPVEFVKDDDSIARYGQLLGALGNNDEIYPSIQGVVIDPLGRIDQIVHVDPVTSDDTQSPARSTLRNLPSSRSSVSPIPRNSYADLTLSGSFDVPADRHANLILDNLTASIPAATSGSAFNRLISLVIDKATGASADNLIRCDAPTITLTDTATGSTRSASGIPAGNYRYEATIRIHNTSSRSLDVQVECAAPQLSIADISTDWSDTWTIYVKDIWQIPRLPGENDTQYARRVWQPILGDHLGSDAKVIFSSGWLSTSQDYEFLITGIPAFDNSHTLDGVPSHWRITLAKSDADLDSTGLHIPSSKRQAAPGDHFFFTGIDLPHQYVIWAEQRLDDSKKDHLRQVADIRPTWVVALDKVRIHNHGNPGALIDSLIPGNSLRLADNRFISTVDDAYETLYLQSITYNYNEPSHSEAAIIPDVEIVLSDSYQTIANPVTALQGQVDALARQVGSISNIEQIVRLVGDNLYIRKDGLPDRSLSPTQFASMLSSLGFRAGMVGGDGWGFYQDQNGNWVIEADRLVARQDLSVNNLVINQIISRSGLSIDTAASITVTRVEESTDAFTCYFDQKGGSVANLFHIDDVAYCNRFTPLDQNLKFYRRRVTDLGPDFIVLTKGYPAVTLPDGSTDTGVNGSGTPAEGDVIVHYGNYSDPARRYVKVRDVISGGYERYIENLDSVNASGTEYYFIGRQAGMYNGRPRFFIGDADGYIEWINGVLNIKGRLDILSTLGGKTIDRYIADVADDAADKARKELQAAIDTLQNQLDGVIESFNGLGAPTLSNFPASGWTTDEERRRHDRDIYTDITPYVDDISTPTSGQSWKWYYNSPSSYGWTKIADSEAVRALQLARMSILDTDILYINHSSPTQPPALPSVNTQGSITDLKGWSTTAPDWDATKYIWQTTYVRKGNNDSAFSDPTCISGRNGADGPQGPQGPQGVPGKDGADGTNVTITAQSVKYSTAFSSTTQPADTTFTLTAVPALAPGQYLWSRTSVTYSNGDSTVTYAVSRIGTDGTDGSSYTPNLLTGTRDWKGWTCTTALFSPDGSTHLGLDVIHGKVTADYTSKWGDLQLNGKTTLENDTIYTLSMWARGTGRFDTFIWPDVAATKILIDGTPDNGTENDTRAIHTLHDQWTRHSVIFRTKKTGDLTGKNVLAARLYKETPSEMWIAGVKLEKGHNENTAWSPHPSEMTGVTITSRSVTYAKTTSPLQPADSAFIHSSITAAAPAPGDYLWSRTAVTYSDGSQPLTTYAVSRIGADGTDGTPAADGFLHFAYANSPDGISGFSTTYFDGALYIGTCYDNNAADPTTATSYTWARLKGDKGDKGDTGDKGNGIQSINEYYAVNNSPSTPPSSWQKNPAAVPTPTSTSRYLWNYEEIIYTSGSIFSTQPRIAGSLGLDGTSVTIRSTSVTYQASPSATGTPTGTWSTSIPPVPAGNYLWTKTVVTYSNNDSTTTYSVSRQGADGADGANYTPNLLLKTDVKVDNANYLIHSYKLAEAPADNQTMTLTIWGELASAKSDFVAYNSGGIIPLATPAKIADGIYSVTFSWRHKGTTTTAANTHIEVYVFPSSVKDVNSRIDRIKLEYGRNPAPVWTPAASEMVAPVILSTAVTYAKGNYPTQPADSAFTLTAPGTLSKNQWLWTRTTVTYSDGAQTQSYSAAYIGADGTDGIPGLDGYVHFAYCSAITGSLPSPSAVTGFSTTPFSGAKYIGIYSDHTAADSSDFKKYHWSEYRGDDGEDGRSFISADEYYLATSDGSNAPVSGWKSSFADAGFSQTNRYLWNYEIAHYDKDPKSVPSTPRIIGVWGQQGPQGLQGLQGPQGTQGIPGSNYSGNLMVATADSHSVTYTTGGDHYFELLNCKVSLEQGKKYTISGKTNAAIFSGQHGNTQIDRCVLWICSRAASSPQGVTVNQIVSNSAMTTDGAKGYTFTWNHPTGEYFLRVNFYIPGTWWIKEVKVEPGTVTDTAWTPAPSEMIGKTSYFHIKYSAIANPTSPSDMTETPSTYIGTYVDFTPSDSSDPKKYTWHRFEGLQGPDGNQGIPGKNGEDGKTSYLHIKYSDDGKTFTPASGNLSPGETPGAWIGQYTDFVQTDSSDFDRYTWSPIKGDDARSIYLRGAQNNFPAGESRNRIVRVCSTDIINAAVNRGVTLLTLDRQTLAPVFRQNYDLYSDNASSHPATDALIAALQALSDDVFVTLTSFDAMSMSKELADELARFGGIIDTNFYSQRRAFAFIGYKNAPKGYAIWMIDKSTGTATSAPAEVSVYVADGMYSVAPTQLGITSITEQYYLSTSRTSLSGGSWSDTRQPWIAGHFYWTRSKVTYTDGSVRYIGEICATGDTGPTGASVLAQYSTDASSWHSVFASGDIYMRTSSDNGTTWTPAIRIVGENYWATDQWVDARSYDENKWIPFTGTPLPLTGYSRVNVAVQLNSNTKPSWSTHNSGFSVNLDVETQASGWGTTLGRTIIYLDNYAWCAAPSPVSYQQMNNSSTPVLFLRGGGRYRVMTTHKCTWTPRPDGYTAGNQTVTPQDTRPKPDGEPVEGKWRKFQWAKNNSSTTEPTSGWKDAPMTAAAGEYIWMRSGLVIPPATTPASWDPPVRITGDRGSDGQSTYMLDLSNEVQGLPCSSDGSVTGTYQSAQATVWKGAGKITSGVTFRIADASGISASVNSSGLVTFSDLTATSASVTVEATVDGVTLQATATRYKVLPGSSYTPNLLTGTRDWKGWTRTTALFSPDNTTHLGLDVMHGKVTDQYTGTYGDLQLNGKTTLENDTIYTLSMWARGTGRFDTFIWPDVAATKILIDGTPDNGTENDTRAIHTLHDQWTRHSVIFRTKKTGDLTGKNVLAARIYKVAPSEIWIAGVKLEKGHNENTAWSPHPSEMTGTDAKVVTVNADAQAFIYSDNFKTLVGPQSIKLTATLQGTSGYQWYYRRPDSTDFVILNGATASTFEVTNNSVTLFGTNAANRSVTIRCLSGGAHDEITIVKVSSGSNGTNGTNGAAGKDAYTVILSNESHTFAAATSAAIAANTSCDIIAYKGATRVPATIGNITGLPTGMTLSIANNGTTSASFALQVTSALTTRQGIISIPLTVDGISFTRQFSWSLALKGTTGATGPQGAAAVTYDIIPGVDSITRSATGLLSASSVSCSVYKNTGNSSRVLTAEKTLTYQRLPDGASGTLAHSSGVSSAVSVLASTEAIIFELKDGDTILDRERVPVLADASDLVPAGQNLVLNSGFSQGSLHWNLPAAVSVDKSMICEGCYAARIDSTANTSDRWNGISQEVSQNPALDAPYTGDYYVFSIWARCDNLSSIDQGAYLEFAWKETDGNHNYTTSIKPAKEGQWQRFSIIRQCPPAATSLRCRAYVVRNGTMWLAAPMITRGNTLTDYTPSPRDTNYLYDALRESATLDGGLILASLLRLGYTDPSSALYRVMAGINGIYRSPNTVAIWAGGDVSDDDASGATMAFRMDGTGFAADKVIRFNKDNVSIGDDVILDTNGLTLYDSSHQPRLRVVNDSVGSDLDFSAGGSLYPPSDWTPTVALVPLHFDKNTYTFRDDTKQTWSLGQLPAGTKISANIPFSISVDLPTNPPSSMYAALSASVIVAIESTSGTSIVAMTRAYFRSDSPSRGDYKTTASLTCSIPTTGTYRLRVQLVPATDAESSPATDCPLIMKSRTVAVTPAFATQTVLGADGLLSTWGNAGILITAGKAMLAAGKYAIRLTTSGIEINRGTKWENL